MDMPPPADPHPGRARAWGALLGPAPLAPADRHRLHALARMRCVAVGDAVFHRGQAANSLVALLQGDVALGLCHDSGAFHTDRVLRGPAWLDLGSAWLPAALRPVDTRARSVAWVAELPADAMARALAGNPALAGRLIQGLARELQAQAATAQALVHKAAPARLAQWLHEQLAQGGTPAGAGTALRLPMRKRDLAAQLAVTPETLSRLMRSFTRQGVLEVAGYTVRVLDMPALEALAKG